MVAKSHACATFNVRSGPCTFAEVRIEMKQFLILLFATAVYSQGATTYSIGPGKTYPTIGAAPWSSLAAGDTVNIYPQTAITGTTVSASSGTTITLTGSAGSIPYGSSVWFSGITGTAPWVTCGVWGSGLYGTARGGTACSGSAVTINDAVSVGAGVTVYFTPPYFEKLILTAAGTVAQPILIQGVPDPITGALPILDSHNATTGPNMAHSGSVAFHDSYGFVLFLKSTNGLSWPTYMTLKGIRIQSARGGLTGFDGSNTSYTYVANSGIRLENADHVTLDGLEVLDSDSGIFGKTDPGTVPAQFINSLLITRCHFYRTGSGSGQHQNYLEANGIIYEYNWYDKPTAGSACSQLKDRSRGTVIRYNLFYPSARELDLVAAQSGYPKLVDLVALTVPSGGFTPGATSLAFTSSVSGIHVGDRVGWINNTAGWGYPGSGQPVMPTVSNVDTGANTLTLDSPGLPASVAAGQTLTVVSQQVNAYRQSFVYGNVFDWDQSLYLSGPGALVHYGWDTAGGIDSVLDRAGTLYFYHNTVITRWDQSGSTGASYYVNIFQTESSADTIAADNNLFYVTNSNVGNTATYFYAMARSGYAGLQTVGVLGGGNNQIVSSAGIGSNTCGTITKTGWGACNESYTDNATINVTGWTTITTAQAFPSGLNGRNYHLQAGSTAIGAASALPAAISSNTLGLDLTPTSQYGGATRSTVVDIGAYQYGSSLTGACDMNGDGQLNVVDVQLAVQQALGLTPCGKGDVNNDGQCNVIDVQIIINGALGRGCSR